MWIWLGYSRIWVPAVNATPFSTQPFRPNPQPYPGLR